MHVHVSCGNGEAKFWLEPIVALAKNYGLTQKQLKEAQNIIERKNREIGTTWKKHFRN